MTQTFLPIFYSVSILLIVPAIGFCLRRYTSWPKEFFEGLNRFIVSVTLPLLLFTNIAKTDLAQIKSSFAFTGFGVGIILLAMAFSFLIFRLFKIKGNLGRVGLAMASIGNSGYMPLIVLELLPLSIPGFDKIFSRELAILFISAYLLGQNPTLWTLGNYLIAGKGQKPVLTNLINPPMIGIFLGFCIPLFGLNGLLQNDTLPFFFINNTCATLGKITLPLVLISLGAMMANIKIDSREKGTLFKFVGIVVFMRFVFVPAIFYLLYFYALLPLEAAPVFMLVMFLETHTPPALNLTVMAGRSGQNTDYTALATLVTYLLFIVVLPFYLFLFLGLPGWK
jgi:malate permease and related proteins